jgi:hypothetical protein
MRIGPSYLLEGGPDPARLDLYPGPLAFGLEDVADRHVRSRPGEGKRMLAPETSRAAGDDRDATLEVEEFRALRAIPSGAHDRPSLDPSPPGPIPGQVWSPKASFQSERKPIMRLSV